MDVVGREHEFVMQIRHHTAELAVDEIERADEISRRDAHESLHDLHLRFSSATADDLLIKAFYKRTIQMNLRVMVSG